jgi:hypothetical protein
MAENVNTQDTNGVKGVTFSEPPAYLSEALNDAERLLKYAAAAGINIDKDIRASILQARAAASKVWTEETADNLLAAFTKLAALVKPVTADSLKWWEENRQIRRIATATSTASSDSTSAACSSSTPVPSGGSTPAASSSSTPGAPGGSTSATSGGSTPAASGGSTPVPSGGSTPAPPSGTSQRPSSRSTRGLWVLFRKWSERRPYVLVTILLGLIIVPFSVVSFVSSAISGAIQTDIKTANDLAAKLREQLGPLPAVTQAAASTDGASSASPSSSATPAGSSSATPAGSSSATPAGSSSATPAGSSGTTPAGSSGATPTGSGGATQAGSSSATPAGFSSATPAASALLPGVKESEVIAELQQFASSIRDVDGRARQLNRLFLNNVPDPFFEVRGDPTKIRKIFQLPQGLPDLAKAASDRIMVYQEVRYFAQNLLDEVSFYFGACTACILPVLYALFGTCAYLLRSVEQKAYTPPADFARFLIAGIGGAVVGLFNNFSIAQGPSIPPLAIAFLVGYAVDVFFAFLENLLPKK